MAEGPLLLEEPLSVARASADDVDHLARREAPELFVVERLAQPVIEEMLYGVAFFPRFPALPFPASASGTGKASLNA